MTSVEQKAYQATWEVISTGKNALPLPAWTVVSLTLCMRRMWRFYRRAKVYANPNNFFHLAAGHLLLSDQNQLVSISARLVLIAVRLQECFDHLLTLKDACDELKYSWKGKYIKPIPVDWIKGYDSHFFSPSTKIWWQEKWHSLTSRISHIFFCLIRIVKEAFLLSMHVMDAVEAFFYSEEIKRESVHELLVNGSILLGRFRKDKKNTLKTLQRHSGFLDNFLQKINIPFTTAPIIKNLSRTVCESDQNFFSNYGKKLIFQGVRSTGYQRFLSGIFLPMTSLDLPKEQCQFFPRSEGLSPEKNPAKRQIIPMDSLLHRIFP